MDHGGVAKTNVHSGGARDALQSAVQGLDAVLTGLFWPCLHIGFIHLNHVCAVGKQLQYLCIQGHGIVHGRLLFGGVKIVLRLLQHGERARHRDLDLALCMGLEKKQILQLDGPGAPDLAHNAGHRVGVAGTVQAHAWVIDVNALQCGGDAIGIALTADFAVGDDVQTGIFLGADGEQGGVLHGLL